MINKKASPSIRAFKMCSVTLILFTMIIKRIILIAKILVFSLIKELCAKLDNGPWENSSLPELVNKVNLY